MNSCVAAAHMYSVRTSNIGGLMQAPMNRTGSKHLLSNLAPRSITKASSGSDGLMAGLRDKGMTLDRRSQSHLSKYIRTRDQPQLERHAESLRPTIFYFFTTTHGCSSSQASGPAKRGEIA
eukprot:2797558-Amphidinium_carterae.1